MNIRGVDTDSQDDQRVKLRVVRFYPVFILLFFSWKTMLLLSIFCDKALYIFFLFRMVLTVYFNYTHIHTFIFVYIDMCASNLKNPNSYELYSVQLYSWLCKSDIQTN